MKSLRIAALVAVSDNSAFDGSSGYELSLTIPADGPCGEYTVVAEGVENEEIIVDTSAAFSVPCPEEPTSTDPTPTSETPTSAVQAVAATTAPRFTG